MKTLLLFLWLSLVSCEYKPEKRYHQTSDYHIIYWSIMNAKGYQLDYLDMEYRQGDSLGHFKQRYYFAILTKY